MAPTSAEKEQQKCSCTVGEIKNLFRNLKSHIKFPKSTKWRLIKKYSSQVI